MRSKLTTLFELLRNEPVKGLVSELPRHFGPYKLEHRLANSRNRPFLLGEYIEERGRRVVIKFWKGKRVDRHYFALKQEAMVLELISRLGMSRGHGRSLKIGFPRYIESIEYPGVLAMVSEFVEGEKNFNLKSAEYMGIFNAIADYMRVVYDQIKDSGNIRVKDGSYYFAMFPLLVFLAFRNKPSHRGVLIRAVARFYQDVWKLFGSTDLNVVHGDLHPDNILLTSGRIYLLDCEQLMCTYAEYEYITSLASKRLPKRLKEQLLIELRTLNRTDTSLHRRLNALAVFCAVFNLAGNTTETNTRSYVELLALALDDQFRAIYL